MIVNQFKNELEGLVTHERSKPTKATGILLEKAGKRMYTFLALLMADANMMLLDDATMMGLKQWGELVERGNLEEAGEAGMLLMTEAQKRAVNDMCMDDGKDGIYH